MIDESILKDIISEASLAPSAHNTQPVRVGYNKSDDSFTLSIDTKRELPIADPTNKDAYISMGCFVEGLELSLLKRNYAIDQIKFKPEKGIVFISTKKQPHPEITELQNYIFSRFCHRGKFRELTTENLAALKEFYQQQENCLWLYDPELKKEMAHDYDQAAWSYLNQDDYYQELHYWCRLDQNHSHYYKDGLNLDSMGLQSWEKPFAKVIMKPNVLNFMKRIHMAKPLLSEADKTKSAAGLLVIHGKKEDNFIQWGRIFYRQWLNLSKFQAAGSPLSSLIDHSESIEKWERKLNIPSDSKIINILRVGGFSEKDRPKRCRLDIESILQEEQV
ncbi:MAG: hypothetical protein CME62_13335 [Halobacteriovoraceae bacterium]|nr:hypothetical protein [Halobacteriovoraceae bacterium]|tara:strand:+ start:13064 stop:14062 length:999 start_codon:yes stop_codon:yes gene_type:complete